MSRMMVVHGDEDYDNVGTVNDGDDNDNNDNDCIDDDGDDGDIMISYDVDDVN